MYKRESAWSGFWCGLLIAAGLSVLGWFVMNTALSVKRLDRTVSVKGLSERLVKADIAIYPIELVVADNNPIKLSNKLKAGRDSIESFLKSQGFGEDEIFVSSPRIVDNYANEYNSNARFRYTGKLIITLYTHQVDKVVSLGKKLFKLSEMGVMATNQKFQTVYLYTQLNKIKPIMIEQAIQNAHKVAMKFANESNSELGPIKTARQGYFSITDRDPNTPYIKRVRVVVNVVYYLR
ncbi:SIMPL domain-containing protein [Hippea sp. KM1]|uniref:SIMPL domain-containing protein n=1 Tax=Hippea sp. KM1 TaxID=944481 RepID=UPI00046CF4B3|nr:SIMPL domain-containing protein [Hippea sp. KM1]